MPSPSEPRDLRLYLEDMLSFAERALAYSSGLAQTTWAADRMRYDATLRNLEAVGLWAGRAPRRVAGPG